MSSTWLNFGLWSAGMFFTGLFTGYVYAKAKYEEFKK